MPQYSRAYCVPTQAVMCLLRLLYACLGCCMPAQPAAPLSQYTAVYCDTKSCLLLLLVTIHSVYCDPIPQPSQPLLVTIYYSVLRHNFPALPALSLSQYNQVYCDTLLQPQASSVTIHLVYCDTIHQPFCTPKTCCVTIQFPIVL